MAKASLSSLAEVCGVSTSTVSRALSGHPAVRAEVRAKIEAAAAKHGYRRNDLVGKLMSNLRAGRTSSFLGNLAVIHVPSAAQPKLLPAQRRCIAGAVARAKELRFKLDEFSYGQDGLDAAGYGRVLRARGVQGVIFLFSEPTGLLTDFPIGEFAALEIDYGQPNPTMNTVCLDHFGTMTDALDRLAERGYRRVGLFVARFKDRRIRHKWSAAFASCQRHAGRIGNIPILIEDDLNETAFKRWHAEHRPDVVVGHEDEAVAWLQKAGWRVPQDTAFFNLSWSERKRACAGLDLRLELQGEVAAETIIAQIQRGELGQPHESREIMVRGRWVEGPTIRAAAGRA